MQIRVARDGKYLVVIRDANHRISPCHIEHKKVLAVVPARRAGSGTPPRQIDQIRFRLPRSAVLAVVALRQRHRAMPQRGLDLGRARWRVAELVEEASPSDLAEIVQDTLGRTCIDLE